LTLRWPWIAAFAVFVVCIPLFAWHHHFFSDWPIHLAMIGYVGEYLKVHGALPATFDTNDTVGRATPMFYGGLYLPVLGALSAVVGARAALSLAVVALLLLQFASVRALIWDATRDEAVACAAAVIVTWAIYPLTDLYNRAAIPEFFAITALQTGSCLWALYARDPARRPHSGLAAGLLVTLAAGIHPPTALFGGLTFAVLWLASLSWCPDRRRLLRCSLATGAAAAGVLAPWLYVMARFGGQLQIVRGTSSLTFFPTSLDAFATRLSLVPTVGPEVGAVSTPNLDPQVSVPLAVVLVLLAIVGLATGARLRQNRRAFAFAAICAAATGALFVLSTCAPAWKALPKAFMIIQFPYRLVAFVNVAVLGALTGVLAALGRVDGDAARSGLWVRVDSHAAKSRLVLAVGVIVATLGVGLKLPRCLEGGSGVDAVVTDYANPPRDCYFGSSDYATPDAFPKVDDAAPKQAVKLTVGAPHGFGVSGWTHVHAAVRTQVSTNVQAFPWNVLTIDGHPVSREATLSDGVKLATWIDPGDHDVGYAFRPDRAWLALRVSSLGLLFVWACGATFGPALAGRLSRWRESARGLKLSVFRRSAGR
jgi:hypothetical protein